MDSPILTLPNPRSVAESGAGVMPCWVVRSFHWQEDDVCVNRLFFVTLWFIWAVCYTSSHSALLCNSMLRLNLPNMVNFAEVALFFYSLCFSKDKLWPAAGWHFFHWPLVSCFQPCLVPISPHPSPELLCSASCLSASQGLWYCARIECLHMTS